jgi:hypothetical protein
VHRSRGQPSGRRTAPAVRERVLLRCAERYPDFGPTLAAEYLRQEGLVVDHETLRRWLIGAGGRTVRRRRQRHRQWRERQACFGAMVQLDGSHHDGFEGRRAKCVLRVMVDDATNRVWAQFFEEETTQASYDVFEGGVRRHRLPRRLYVDRDSIYRCEGLGSVAEQLAGKAPQTQFGRAMEQRGVQLILANSPQAKGRVERMNGVLQDRLVKALRLAGIHDLAGANHFLAEAFLPAFNRQFNVVAASPADGHGAVPRQLDEVLSWEDQRVVQRDWTVAHAGRWYQVDRQHEALSLAGRKVIVRVLRDGRVQLVHRGTKLRWRALPARPVRQHPEPVKAARQGGEAAGAGASVAATGRGCGAGVLARREGARAGGARGGAVGGAGLRSASATLRPPSVPPRQPREQSTEPQLKKGTFSRELRRGHFKRVLTQQVRRGSVRPPYSWSFHGRTRTR